MKYQLEITLGNFESWEEANAFKQNLYAFGNLDSDKVISARVVDNNVKAGPR